jgi:hypothetical protein
MLTAHTWTNDDNIVFDPDTAYRTLLSPGSVSDSWQMADSVQAILSAPIKSRACSFGQMYFRGRFDHRDRTHLDLPLGHYPNIHIHAGVQATVVSWNECTMSPRCEGNATATATIINSLDRPSPRRPRFVAWPFKVRLFKCTVSSS